MDADQLPAAMVEAAARAVHEHGRLEFTNEPAWEGLAEEERDSYRKAERLALAAAFGAGERHEEWGVWWHGPEPKAIRLSEYRLTRRSEAVNRGHERLGDYGITGFTVVHRIHIRFDQGEWSTVFERDGDPIWVGEPT